MLTDNERKLVEAITAGHASLLAVCRERCASRVGVLASLVFMSTCIAGTRRALQGAMPPNVSASYDFIEGFMDGVIRTIEQHGAWPDENQPKAH